VLQICPHIIHVSKTVIHIKVHMSSVDSPTKYYYQATNSFLESFTHYQKQLECETTISFPVWITTYSTLINLLTKAIYFIGDTWPAESTKPQVLTSSM